MSPFALSSVLTAILPFSFGLLVYYRCPNRKLVLPWLIYTYTVVVWGIGAFVVATTRNIETATTAWLLINGFGVTYLPAALYHFTVVFLDLKDRRSIVWQYLIAVGFAILLTRKQFFYVHSIFNDSMFYTRGGVVFAIQVVWWIALSSYIHLLLFRAFKRETAQKRNQIKYFFLGMALTFSGGSLCWLPSLGIYVYPWGNFTSFMFPLVMTYAILKHNLMDIQLVLRKSLVYSVMTATLTAMYLSIASLTTHLLHGYAGSAGVWASAIAVAVMTLIFNPLLNRIYAFVDRQVFGDWLQEIGRGVAHEVKQPLNSISMPAQLTLMELEDIEKGNRSFESYLPTLKARLRMIQSKAFEVGNRVEALRSISDPHREPREPLNLRPLLLGLVAGFKDTLERTKVEIHMDVPESLSWVKGDTKQLEVVFGNLIKNAIEAIASAEGPSSLGRHVWIRGMEEGKWVTLVIKDSGAGIQPADLRHLFDVYFTTKGAHGTGVGLYLAKKVILDHNGLIDVASTPGQGTEFIVRLPKYETHNKNDRSGLSERYPLPPAPTAMAGFRQ